MNYNIESFKSKIRLSIKAKCVYNDIDEKFLQIAYSGAGDRSWVAVTHRGECPRDRREKASCTDVETKPKTFNSLKQHRVAK